MNSAGPSTATASATVVSVRPASATVAASAAARPSTARVTWVAHRYARGTNASTSTPAQATPSTIRTGDRPV